MDKKIDLSSFSIGDFNKGASSLKIVIWYFVNALIVKASWNPFMKIKISLLKIFGAKIGKGLVIKNKVNIKFPWKIIIGDNCWIGEDVWIDNLDNVIIEGNVCISQGALLLTGNHDYRLLSFDYRNAPIDIKEGTWIGAKAVVCPGVVCKKYSILTVGSVATKDLEERGIYQGNPAVKIRDRKFINDIVS